MLEAATKTSGGLAVMNKRHSALDSLDLFPSPPWSTRAMLAQLQNDGLIRPDMTAWEPAAGLGHMADVMRETFSTVHTSDVFDYGCNAALGSFIGVGPDVAQWPAVVYGAQPDWIITNPPFNASLEFALRAISEARVGAAVLVRTNWLEGGERYRSLFARRAPQLILQYAARVPMHRDRWDPDGDTMTAYCWVIWYKAPMGVRSPRRTEFVWLPETTEQMHTRADDRHKYAGRRPPWVTPEMGTLL